MFFRPPRGLHGIAPKVHAEQEKWVEAGLIPPFSDESNADKVIADMLRAVREHLEDQG